MSEFMDLLTIVDSESALALLLLVLMGVDLYQTRNTNSQLGRIRGRLRRLEDQFIAADGGDGDE
ncbi:hypothetical protein SAMN04488063_0117 [Halopelagius inordinatus]|uniref:Uncharacterized protein n=1 Tax=Halopelagius inordinatus TaxID=553467 RepID=A0A1I2X309_9EURY|nr:hypothetical protein [Halopelagius inordinatus]SFH07908.1 hypothetical protein SAMN04488063_0117 [Halopelagius inordinatus]